MFTLKIRGRKEGMKGWRKGGMQRRDGEKER